MPMGKEGKSKIRAGESQEKTSLRAWPLQLTRQKETLHFLPVDVSLRRSYNFPRGARNYYSQGLFARTPRASAAPGEGSNSNKNKG